MALSDFDDLPQLSEYPHLVLDSLLENNHIRRELDTKDFPFRLRRKQFPIVPAFALTAHSDSMKIKQPEESESSL
ncbi:unnamed protein product [Lampetra planeri]